MHRPTVHTWCACRHKNASIALGARVSLRVAIVVSYAALASAALGRRSRDSRRSHLSAHTARGNGWAKQARFSWSGKGMRGASAHQNVKRLALLGAADRPPNDPRRRRRGNRNADPTRRLLGPARVNLRSRKGPLNEVAGVQNTTRRIEQRRHAANCHREELVNCSGAKGAVKSDRRATRTEAPLPQGWAARSHRLDPASRPASAPTQIGTLRQSDS